MEPAVRLASGVAAPLVRELFVPPQRPPEGEELIAGTVSFRGLHPTTTYDDLERLAREFVRHGLDGRNLPMREDTAVAAVLARTLAVMGELDTTDVQAVRLGPQDWARLLRAHVPGADRKLTEESAWFHDSLLVAVCLHALHLFVQRSPYIADRLPERSHRIRQLVDLGDVSALRERRRQPSPEDAAFEERYLRSVVEEYNRVTIYGIDLPNPNTPDSWPLETTYLSLGAEFGVPGGRSRDDAPAPPEGGSAAGDADPVMPADRALAGQERVLLRGVAGSGKTTLVQWLAVATARGRLPEELAALRGRVPVVLPVRRFARQGFPAPDDFLDAVGHPLADEAPDGWMARLLADERALLLVDGIDEAPEDQRPAVRDALRRMMRIYSGTCCLVTARPPAVDAAWLADEGFDELTLAPMNRDQVAAFITAWHTAARTDTGDDHAHLDEYRDRLLQTIPLYRELRGLATNPLMCGLICALNRDRSGSMPKGRRELYEAAMEMLLQRRDPERRVLHADEVHLQRAARERLLRKLAFRMLLEDRAVLGEAAAVEEIARCLPAIPAAAAQGTPTQIFGHLLQRTGLLREQADGAVEFVHRTVQDYLAAKEAVERGDLALLLEHAHEPQWEEVIRMAVAHARPGECGELLAGLMAPGKVGMQRNRRRLLAAACLEHVTELDPVTHARIRRETRHMVRPTSVAAARGLGWVGPIVLEMLPDPETVDDDEAYRIALTVTRIADDAAVHYLSRLRRRPSLPLTLRAELMRGWRNFDTERYAEDIVAHLDPSGLYFPVTDRVELAVLRRLGGRECVQVAGHFTPGELLAGLDRGPLRHLWLTYDLGVSMEWLADFPSLTTLRVNPRLPRVGGVPEGIRIIS
ncbi:NACHT domain-containing protein [Streptomyces sp. RKND-216]|uniref:NACHT domain-containing protein n=1 Tax=Streptomyces sp. RKND-216 TaxID=2562581 RepID=UPI00109E15A0|nr:NACHT domain-containing protein [Streptomyces sp. RKND-216]THA25160.1 NACHT domain-containing protein [Streptomyces sp. RKND-216]